VGQPIDIRASVTHRRGPLDGVKVRTRVSAPRAAIDDYLRKYGAQLSRIRIPPDLRADGKPDKARLQVAQLVLLRDSIRQQSGEDILAPVVHDVVLGEASPRPRGPRGVEDARSSSAVATGGPVGGGILVDPRQVQRPRAVGMQKGRFVDTKIAGSYTVRVTAAGFSPACNSRFTRHSLLSVVAAQRG